MNSRTPLAGSTHREGRAGRSARSCARVPVAQRRRRPGTAPSTGHRPPGRCHGGAGTEAGVVPERQRAAGRVGCQIGPEPALLLRTGLATADLVAVGVERDQMPASQVEAVPALAGLAGPWSEEPVVAAGAGGLVVVVARSRIGPVAEATPARQLAARELAGRAVVGGGVAKGEDRPWPGVEQGRGLLVAAAGAAGGVAGGQQGGRPLPGSLGGRRRAVAGARVSPAEGLPAQPAARAAARTTVTANQHLAPTGSLACRWWNQPPAVISLVPCPAQGHDQEPSPIRLS
jgi:hypothetical protein